MYQRGLQQNISTISKTAEHEHYIKETTDEAMQRMSAISKREQSMSTTSKTTEHEHYNYQRDNKT